MSSTVHLQAQIEKLKSSNLNIRLEALKLLAEEPRKNIFTGQDAQLETQLVDQVIAFLSDRDDDIKGQASKCLGQLAKSLRPSQLDRVVVRLLELFDRVDCITGSALRSVIAGIPQDGANTPRIVRKIIPVVLEQAAKLTSTVDTLNDALLSLDILALRFHSHVPPGVPGTLVPLLGHAHFKVRKQVVDTIASLVSSFPSPEIEAFCTSKITPSLTFSSASVHQKRSSLCVISALARDLAPILESIVPCVIGMVEKGDESLKGPGFQALEKLVTTCPGGMARYVPQLIVAGAECASSGPNISVTEHMGSERAENEADSELDDNRDSDDEDPPRVTGSAAIKFLGSLVGAYPEMLGVFYERVAPVLLSRSCGRDPMVRYNAWSALTILIRHTRKVLADKTNFSAPQHHWNLEPYPMAKEIIARVDSLVPELLKTMTKTLSSSPTPPISALVLLDTLFLPLPKGSPQRYVFTSGYKGVLEPFEDLQQQLSLILVQPATLSTLSHVMTVYSCPSSKVLVKLASLMLNRDKDTALTAIQLLVGYLNGRTGLETRFEQALTATTNELLENPNIDAAIRKSACNIVGTLLVNDISCDERSWELIREAQMPHIVRQIVWDTDRHNVGRYEMSEDWLDAHITWCVELICDGDGETEIGETEIGETEIGVTGEAMDCLATLLCQSNFSTLEVEQEDGLAKALLGHLSSASHTLEPAIRLLKILFTNRPGRWWKHTEGDILLRLCSLVSEALSSNSLDQLVDLIREIAKSNGEKSEEEREEEREEYGYEDEDEEDENEESDEAEDGDSCVKDKSGSVESREGVALRTKQKKDVADSLLEGLKSAFDLSGTVGAAKTASRCLAAVVQGQTYLAAQLFKDLFRYLQPSQKTSEASLVLSLMTLGAIGQFLDELSQQRLFEVILGTFASASEHVRDAASSAIGHYCTVSPDKFLSIVMDQVERNQQRRPFLMRGIEEFISTFHWYALKDNHAEALWAWCWKLPSLQDCPLSSSAACLSKLLTRYPINFCSQLEANARDSSQAKRSLAIEAMGHIFRSEASATDEDMKEIDPYRHYSEDEKARMEITKKFEPFTKILLSLIDDKDLNVRASVLVAIIHAISSKPRLFQSHLTRVMSGLGDTVRLEPSVGIGSLESKSAAYEVLNTLTQSHVLFAKLDLDALLSLVLRGLADSSIQVKVFCHTIVQRLSYAASAVVSPRVKEIVVLLNSTTTIDRGAEMTRCEFKTMAALNDVVDTKGYQIMNAEDIDMDLN